jgi:hypothetical protein
MGRADGDLPAPADPPHADPPLVGRRAITYLLVLEFGYFLWIGYGIALGNPFIFFPNTVAAVVGALTMLVAWVYRDGVRPVA